MRVNAHTENEIIALVLKKEKFPKKGKFCHHLLILMLFHELLLFLYLGGRDLFDSLFVLFISVSLKLHTAAFRQ